MKKTFLFCFVILFTAINSFAQNKFDSTKTKGIIKFYPFQMLVGEFRIGYEKPINHNISIETVSGIIYGASFIQEGWDYHDVNKTIYWGDYGFSIRSGLKFYLSSKYNHTNFFVNPILFGTYVNDNERISALHYSYSLGMQFLFGYKFATKTPIDIYLGYGYRKVFQNLGKIKNQINYSTPQLGVSIGLIRK